VKTTKLIAYGITMRRTHIDVNIRSGYRLDTINLNRPIAYLNDGFIRQILAFN
jgi:hypothetical protein